VGKILVGDLLNKAYCSSNIVYSLYAGQQAANALNDVLLGDNNPAGP
jgi:hypothetical protein